MNDRKDFQNEVIWYQQEGATAYTARQRMEIVLEMFPGRLISLPGDLNWPGHSPDMTHCDLSLWVYLKTKVYKHREVLKADKKRSTD